MLRLIVLTLMTSLFWSSAQALENRPSACFSDFDIQKLTIVHDKKSDGKKDGDEKEGEEEPDCE